MESISRAILIFVVLLVFALARRYLPASPARKRGHRESFAELDAKFSTTQWFVGFAMAAVVILFFMSTRAAFAAINRHLAATDGSPQLVILPESAIWWFFPGLAALSLTSDITLLIWGLFGNRKTIELYRVWSDEKLGFRGTLILRLFAIFIAVPVGILTVLALPMHIALGRESIRECGYAFKACQEYRYADARQMTLTDGHRLRDGTLNSRAGVVIDFDDGRRWASLDMGEFQKEPDPALIKFLKQKVPLPFEYTEFEEDIPLFRSQPSN